MAVACRDGHLQYLTMASAFVPGMCFDQQCQAAMDKAFVVAIGIPLLVAIASIAYLLRPVPKELQEKDEIFEDPTTGFVFQAPEGSAPERDRKGELVFRAISYTPWPVADGEEGERVRINVGSVNNKEPRTFVFGKILRGPSKIIRASLPRPMGIDFVEDAKNQRVAVGGFLPGGEAERREKVASVDPALRDTVPKEGDVLRAITCTNFVYPTRALFGAAPPERHIVVYGADGMRWPAVVAAMRKGDKRDGDVTLILERQISGDEEIRKETGNEGKGDGEETKEMSRE
ncbi:unnamed protein product [Ostreobium quekettii]|uniref:Uncharacterized protein n=1 Tax=Ostreobium quekettii TaxID=121088 RepID=A0A8S1INX7_9CHLO|nr:unnamed protein product [Ostreobium quekettii]CAD7701193.1 unnamed protein product [Ostreobium quekettii]|eukprot:evm.model.scf_9.15 EVM.evm.TU.scf_9.15   scf_9:203166-208559(+)